MREVGPLRWLRANGHDLTGLTGTNTRALYAIAACWDLLQLADHPEHVYAAVASLLPTMQPKFWPLARELVARSLDWSDRDRVWARVDLWGRVLSTAVGSMYHYKEERHA